MAIKDSITLTEKKMRYMVSYLFLLSGTVIFAAFGFLFRKVFEKTTFLSQQSHQKTSSQMSLDRGLCVFRAPDIYC